MGQHSAINLLEADRAEVPPFADAIRVPDTIASVQNWHQFTSRHRITAWDALAQWSVEPNPFYESWYLIPSLEALDPDGHVQLFVLEAEGQLVGLMPVERIARYYGHRLPHLRNWVHDNCFVGAPLVARGFETIFWQELIKWADKAPGLALFLHLTHLPSKGPLTEGLAMAVAGSRTSATVMQEERAMLLSGNSSAAYLITTQSKKKRKEFARLRRRLEEQGNLDFERQRTADNLCAWVDEFLELESKSWKGMAGSALGSESTTEAIFRKSLQGAAKSRKLDRLTLRLDGKPIAMLATFRCSNGAFSYKTTFDEDFAKFSPGVLLQCENLSILDDNTVEWVDSCARPDHPMINHLWRERREISRYSIGIGGKLRQAVFAAVARYETGGRIKAVLS